MSNDTRFRRGKSLSYEREALLLAGNAVPMPDREIREKMQKDSRFIQIEVLSIIQLRIAGLRLPVLRFSSLFERFWRSFKLSHCRLPETS